MIALTQEKREELIEKALLKREMLVPNGLNAMLNEIALAALTTSALGRVNLGDVSDNNEYPDAKVDCIHLQADWENFQDGTLLFTCPPMPEIKLPDDNSCEDGLKKHGLRTKEEGISQLSDGFRCGFAWYEHEIKRLNGLGE